MATGNFLTTRVSNCFHRWKLWRKDNRIVSVFVREANTSNTGHNTRYLIYLVSNGDVEADGTGAGLLGTNPVQTSSRSTLILKYKLPNVKPVGWMVVGKNEEQTDRQRSLPLQLDILVLTTFNKHNFPIETRMWVWCGGWHQTRSPPHWITFVIMMDLNTNSRCRTY